MGADLVSFEDTQTSDTSQVFCNSATDDKGITFHYFTSSFIDMMESGRCSVDLRLRKQIVFMSTWYRSVYAYMCTYGFDKFGLSKRDWGQYCAWRLPRL